MTILTKKNDPHKFTDRKKQSFKISQILGDAGYDKLSHDMQLCGTKLQFAECREHQIKKLFFANFCNRRICPMCQWRRSLKLRQQLKQVACTALKREPRSHFLMLTLTVKNVPGQELSETITSMFSAWQKLRQRKIVKKVLKGYFLSLEVTYNKERDDFHPHFHVLLWTPPSYFKKHYIKRDTWLKMWQESTGDHSITQCDIRRIYDKRKSKKLQKNASLESKQKAIESATFEVSKYLTKYKNIVSNHLLTEKQGEVLVYLLEGLKNRKMTVWGLGLAEIKKELNLEDVEAKDASLTDVEGIEDCKCPICQADLELFTYHWMYSYYKSDDISETTKRARLLRREKQESKGIEYALMKK